MRKIFRIPFSRARVEREVDDELAFHIETRVERLIAEGWDHDAARREAHRQFGDVTSTRDSMLALDHQRENAERRATVLTDLRRDVAFAVRTLRRNKAFTALVVGGLALGTGANAAIYSVIHAVIIRELPVVRPGELVAIGAPDEVNSEGVGTPNAASFSYPLYRDIQSRNQIFTDVLATGRANRLDVYVDSSRSAALEHPAGRFVTGNYFALLGVRPRSDARSTRPPINPVQFPKRRSATATGRVASTTTRRSSARRCSSTVCVSRSPVSPPATSLAKSSAKRRTSGCPSVFTIDCCRKARCSPTAAANGCCCWGEPNLA